MSHYSVFHNAESSLAEGLYIDAAGQRLFWVDIDKGEILEKSYDGREFRQYSVGRQPSALLCLRGRKLMFCNSDGVAELNTESGEITLLSKNPETGHAPEFRSNDGVTLPGGGWIYGTMECAPTGINGGLYFFDGSMTKSLDTVIGIPNGFIPLSDSDILIADSYTGRVNLFRLEYKTRSIHFQRCWHDFGSTGPVPDGGCVGRNGEVYIALWDGAGIAVLDQSGRLKQTLPLPVPRPTNCKLAGNETLYVTSARTGLSDAQLAEYPLSGSVLGIQLR